MTSEHPVTVEQRVAEYIRCRDKIAEIKERHEKELEEWVYLQNKLSGWLQTFLEKAGVDSAKTSAGTCFFKTKYTASLADPEAFMKFVIANQDFDLIDRKANVTAVKAYAAEHGALPPGVNLSSITNVGVRRASDK